MTAVEPAQGAMPPPATQPAKASRWKPEEDADNPLYKEDNFRMYCLKVLPCSKRYCHDWTTCPFAHSAEKAKRRDPRVYNYTGVACPEMKKNMACPRGDHCPFAHNVFEYWLHHSRYRTQLCNDGVGCKRKICFFAHTLDELRVSSVKVQVPVDPDMAGLNPFAPSPTTRAPSRKQPAGGPRNSMGNNSSGGVNSGMAPDALTFAELQHLSHLQALLAAQAGSGGQQVAQTGGLLGGGLDDDSQLSLESIVHLLSLAQQPQQDAASAAQQQLLAMQQAAVAAAAAAQVQQLAAQHHQQQAAAAAMALLQAQAQQQMAALQLLGQVGHSSGGSGTGSGPSAGGRGGDQNYFADALDHHASLMACDPFAKAAAAGGAPNLVPTPPPGVPPPHNHIGSVSPGMHNPWAPLPRHHQRMASASSNGARGALAPGALTAAMGGGPAPGLRSPSDDLEELARQLSSMSASSPVGGEPASGGGAAVGASCLPDDPMSARSFCSLGLASDFRRQGTAPPGVPGLMGRPGRFSLDTAVSAVPAPRASGAGSDRSACTVGGASGMFSPCAGGRGGFTASGGGLLHHGSRTSPVSVSALGDGCTTATATSYLSNSLSSHDDGSSDLGGALHQ